MVRTNVFIFIVFLSGFRCEEPKVSLKLGTIHGFKQKIDENDVNVFLGIPYAVPPIGELRFKKPQPVTENWIEPLNATKWPNVCMQDMLFFKYYSDVSEDCLYLNVWTPVNLDKDFSKSLKPVMVFIHGGALKYMGSSFKHYNAPVLSSFGDVVVVTINYRLAAFGFLYAGNSDAPGNMGLYDQALALEWVQENIAYFGGDPTKVTIFGESAGGWSVTLHLLSPLSQDMFKRAIIMSGAVYYGITLTNKNDAVKSTLELAKLLGCTVSLDETQVTDEHMECLRQADAKKIVELHSAPKLSMDSMGGFKLPFTVVVGEAFVPKTPMEALKRDVLSSGKNILIGTVANEGYMVHLGMQLFGLVRKEENWQTNLVTYLKISFKHISDEEIAELHKFYFAGIDDKNSDEAKMAYFTALGDIVFNCETVLLSKDMARSNDVYQYYFDYALVNSNDNLGPCELHKCCHANELPLSFGTVTNDFDIEVSKNWMKILTEFAKTGTVNWPKYNHESNAYYEFTGNQSNDRILYNFRSDACLLLSKVFDKHFK